MKIKNRKKIVPYNNIELKKMQAELFRSLKIVLKDYEAQYRENALAYNIRMIGLKYITR